MNKCFDAYRSTNRRYPLMIYYSVDHHMYWVNNQHKARQLAARGRASSTLILSYMFTSSDDDVNRTYIEEK